MFSEFSDAVVRAKDLAEEAMLAEIRDASKQTVYGTETDWRARAWILERTRRGRYGPEIRIKAQEEALGELLDRIRERAGPAIYEAVLVAIAEEDGEGPFEEGPGVEDHDGDD
jgi:hypothetical protein